MNPTFRLMFRCFISSDHLVLTCFFVTMHRKAQSKTIEQHFLVVDYAYR